MVHCGFLVRESSALVAPLLLIARLRRPRQVVIGPQTHEYSFRLRHRLHRVLLYQIYAPKSKENQFHAVEFQQEKESVEILTTVAMFTFWDEVYLSLTLAFETYQTIASE